MFEGGTRPGQVGYVAGFIGGVVADEPRAATTGRDVLANGGTAADAAVAMYFTLAVTMPTTAGLGGGGVCLIHDVPRGRFDTIDFMPRPSRGGGMSVPSNVRGMALLHVRAGRLRFETLVGPGEQLARFGARVSRALARDMAETTSLDMLDAASRRLFVSAAGRPLGEGANLVQVDLATTLGRVRSAGVGDFYSGQLARLIVEGAQAAGGDLTLEDLRESLPGVKAPLQQALGQHLMLLPPPPASGGAVAADFYAALNYANYAGASPPDRVHLIAEASRRALAAEARRIAGEAGEIGTVARARMLMSDYQASRASQAQAVDLPPELAPAATGFVAMDREGSAVACTVTLQGRFGTGRIIANTGILVAPPPPATGMISMVPALVINTNNQRSFLALSATGGIGAPIAAVHVLLGASVENRPLEDVLARPRMAGLGSNVLIEPEANDSASALTDRGHWLAPVRQIGQVNVIHCPEGLPPQGSDSPRCDLRPDPRGAGLGVGADTR